ncbi:type II toxin-antitoxin system RelE/ParE family toxin [Thiobacillus sp.]
MAAYIARAPVFYAGAVVEKMLSAAAALNLFPGPGRIVPELNQPDSRERFVYSYRLIDRIDPARILVAAVIHGKRLLDDETTVRLAGK